MKILTGALAVSALLVFAPAVEAKGGPKGVPHSRGYVAHQKTGGNHPGGHSSVYGHKKNAGSYSSGYSRGGSDHDGYRKGDGKGDHKGSHHKKKKKFRCFPPGHCKSINQGYYGPPGQRGR